MLRREMFRIGIALAASRSLNASALAAAGRCPGPHLFSKPLEWLDYDTLADTVADAGYGGIELTVRPGGHVEPERVAVDLPRAVAAARQRSLAVDMIVTAIRSAEDVTAERVLRTAAAEGVRSYRMGYLHYDSGTSVPKALDALRHRMAGLEVLNRRCGVAGCYQNHHGSSGGRLGGAVWDIQALLQERDPRWIGCQYDVRHAVAEATGSWDVGLRLIAPRIHSLVFKDFRWQSADSCTPIDVSLGGGVVPWPRVLTLLRELRLDVPMTVHCEWPLLDATQQDLPVSDRRQLVVPRLRKDRDFLAAALDRVGLEPAGP